MSICWLVQFACYSFLSGSAGPLQRRFLTVINRDSFHPPAQFSEGQLTMKEKMERQHLLRDGVQTTPVREHSAQYQWHGPGENLQAVYWKTADRMWWFFEGGASRCRKTGISGSLANLFEPLFFLLIFPLLCFLLHKCGITLSHKHV